MNTGTKGTVRRAVNTGTKGTVHGAVNTDTKEGLPVAVSVRLACRPGSASNETSQAAPRRLGIERVNVDHVNKQREVIALEQLTSHIERRPTATETGVAYDNST